MNIVYADDDQTSLDLVLRALQARGHQVVTVNSSKINDMLQQFQRVLAQGPTPHLVILDGHNEAKDPDGKLLADVQPNLLMNWLQSHGLPAQTPFVLFSSDDQLVATAKENQALGFSAAVAKAGANGGLIALLKIVEGQRV